MNKKKLLISGLTVAGFLAASTLPHLGATALADEQTTPPAKEVKKMEGKKGSCSGGSCGAMKGKKKEETKAKEGSCSAMKKKKKGAEEKGKKGSCTAMKE